MACEESSSARDACEFRGSLKLSMGSSMKKSKKSCGGGAGLMSALSNLFGSSNKLSSTNISQPKASKPKPEPVKNS